MAAQKNAQYASHLNEMLTGKRAASIAPGHVGGGFIVTCSDGKQRRFCGLLDTLRHACYPDYEYKDAVKTAGTPARMKGATGLSRPWHGIQRGRMVHHQIRAYVNCGGEKAVAGMFGNGKGTKSASMQLAQSFMRSLDNPALNLKPVWAEFAVFYEHLALGSSIDLLCTRRDPETGLDELSIIEIKTGYENTFADASGPLLAPPSLKHRNNSPLTQAFLQLAFYRQMISHAYPDVRIGPCYVAQVRLSNTVYHPLPLDIMNAGNDLVAHVAALRFRQFDQKESGPPAPAPQPEHRQKRQRV
jgi:hypothetical protein